MKMSFSYLLQINKSKRKSNTINNVVDFIRLNAKLIYVNFP